MICRILLRNFKFSDAILAVIPPIKLPFLFLNFFMCYQTERKTRQNEPHPHEQSDAPDTPSSQGARLNSKSQTFRDPEK